MAEQEARLQQLRAQQERWMRERDSALERERVEEELQAEQQQQQHPQNGWGAGTSKAGKAAMARADGLVPVEVMDKLTARLADRLRTEIKEEMMEREIKWGTMIPLVGGSALGCERAAGSLPQYHLSYSPFANNEAHLRSHWAEKQVGQKP